MGVTISNLEGLCVNFAISLLDLGSFKPLVISCTQVPLSREGDKCIQYGSVQYDKDFFQKKKMSFLELLPLVSNQQMYKSDIFYMTPKKKGMSIS